MDRGGREVGKVNMNVNKGYGEEEEEVKMELELDAAHALANLAGSDPNQSSVSQEEDPRQLQAKSEETSNESKGNRCRNRTVDKTGNANSVNVPPEVSSTRGQKNLSEAERDAKRLRRILANRESARQTILRRQAFRDELARKVSILSAENLVLQKEKENAAREYFYQKEMNQQLKEQMQMTPLKEEKTLSQLPLSVVPAPEMPVTPRTPGNIGYYSLVNNNENISYYSQKFTAQCGAAARAASSDAPTGTRSTAADVSCSLTLGFGATKDETVLEQKHEATIFGKKINPLLLECEWKEGCKPYPPLDAANARRRRMEIARIKQLNRS